MKKTISALALCCCATLVTAQNYTDQYLTDSLTYTTIAGSAQQVNNPRDLDFKPNTNELWVVNKGTSSGGSVVIVYDAGTASQTSQYRKDTHTSHFMAYPPAIAFSDMGQWACVSEIQSTGGPTSTFMGPALWSSDTAILARVFQNNWVSGLPLGSHYDMLHQSPFAMGIAHDSAKAYWVADGHNGNIIKYDYVADHGPGYDNHSAGILYRYTDVPFVRTVNVPGHMILEKSTGWLYYINSGEKTLRRMNTNTGTDVGPLSTPSTANEMLAGYRNITGAVQETIDTFLTQICGIDVYNGRLIVSDYTNGNIYLYDVTGPNPVFMDTIVTGQVGIQGVKFGTDGKIWFVNNTANTVVRIDIQPAALDASIAGITSPLVQPYFPSFFTLTNNVCASTVAPVVNLVNMGTTTLDSVTIISNIDNVQMSSYTWIGTLIAGASVSVTLPSITPGQGEHMLTVYTVNPNGIADNNPANDRKEGSFRTFNPVFPFPFSEGFSGTTFPPVGWTYVNYNPNNYMRRVTNTGGFGNSSECMKMDHFSGSMNINGQRDHMMTPEIDMSTATAGTTLEFTVAYSQYNTSSNDQLFVKVSTDCGLTWTTIYNEAGSSLSTTTPHTIVYAVPLVTEWRRESIDLTSFIGMPNVIFKFESLSNNGNNLFIDDILIDNTISIDEQTNSNSVSVFPNPTNGLCTVNTKLSNSETGEIIVTNVLGEVMSSTMITGVSNGNYSVDMSTYAAGTYFVSVKTEANGMITKKVLVQH